MRAAVLALGVVVLGPGSLAEGDPPALAWGDVEEPEEETEAPDYVLFVPEPGDLVPSRREAYSEDFDDGVDRPAGAPKRRKAKPTIPPEELTKPEDLPLPVMDELPVIEIGVGERTEAAEILREIIQHAYGEDDSYRDWIRGYALKKQISEAKMASTATELRWEYEELKHGRRSLILVNTPPKKSQAASHVILMLGTFLDRATRTHPKVPPRRMKRGQFLSSGLDPLAAVARADEAAAAARAEALAGAEPPAAVTKFDEV